ncbi:MAG: hypothetical protein KatS3mg038_1077 [Candidatus Kapaibacterium sp.]|nr:MAG: hypothetical protein KatS3mg038_1077 [Candidatus Kapabacteria bacterium]GIV56681.1 MAG: hypothetical protein KatS3mg040_1449 [Candidatus Kapabacteria bacterium]
MKANMGGLDRGLRIVIAIIIAVLLSAGAVTGTWAIILGIVAVIFLLTSFVSFCPVYALFGMSTRKVKQNE